MTDRVPRVRVVAMADLDEIKAELSRGLRIPPEGIEQLFTDMAEDAREERRGYAATDLTVELDGSLKSSVWYCRDCGALIAANGGMTAHNKFHADSFLASDAAIDEDIARSRLAPKETRTDG